MTPRVAEGKTNSIHGVRKRLHPGGARGSCGREFLANRYDKSYDSTTNKQFSLSDQTIKVVKGLKSDVQLTYFGAQTDFRGARDTLDRYSSLSPKLHVTYVDPERKPQVAKAAGFRSDSTVIVEKRRPAREREELERRRDYRGLDPLAQVRRTHSLRALRRR